MKYILLPPATGERLTPFYFAVEEYVARSFPDDDYFFIWQVPPTVMLGRNQLLQGEIDESYCQSEGIHVVRRRSGGGCVYADGGCLQFSFVVREGNAEAAFRRCMMAVADSLVKAGIPATLSGRNDILVDGRKVAGAAFYRTGGRSVLHNTLLFSTDLQHLTRALTPPAEKVLSKGVQSVRERVTGIAGYTEMSLAEFVSFERRLFCGDAARQLTEDDLDEISRLEATLASDAFIRGHNPRYTLVRKQHVPGVGYVEAYVELKDNVVRGVNLLGDYFVLGDVDKDFLDLLRGAPFTRDDFSAALAAADPARVIRGLDTHRFLRLLFGREPHVPKPDWLKINLAATGASGHTAHAVASRGLHTICESGLCPNRAECWRAGTATFMIGGDICTRRCRFCNTRTGRPLPPDPEEPHRVAEAIREMKLQYAVLTSVDRDDLPDQGADLWAATVRAVRAACPDTRLEVLLPDFQGRTDLLDRVLAERPDVVGHNMETTRRLTPAVRSVATYERSLAVLRHVAAEGFPCKTGFMVGLGETREEVGDLLRDICATGCNMLTIGQYLQPTARHLPVSRYVEPKEFAEMKREALSLGFRLVVSGPLVRSSFHAAKAVPLLKAHS